MAESVYLNLEDDVAKIVARVKKAHGDKVVLVCPKRCQLFSDSINLRLLKKQADLLGKEISVLTMDEKGQIYAQEAGFALKFLPKAGGGGGFSDIKVKMPVKSLRPEDSPGTAADKILETFKGGLAGLTEKIMPGPKEVAEKEKKKPGHGKRQIKEEKIKISDTVFPDVIEPKARKKKLQKKSGQRALVGLVAISILLVLAVVFVVLPSATVAIYPKTEPVTRELEISAGAGITDPDAARLVLPASRVSESLESLKKFQSQGKREVGNKATGLVKLYNFTDQPINLKANTTVLSVGNKFYNLTEDITLHPPTRYANETTKEVDVGTLGESYGIIASEGGESFNLPESTRMEITNQVFGSRPQFLYARTDTAVFGGTSRYLSVVSEEDIANAQEELQEELLQQLNSKLLAQNLILVDGAFETQDAVFESEKTPGTESPSFTASLRMKVNGLAFNNQQLQKLVVDRILQTLSSGKSLNSAGFDLANIRVKNLNLENGIVSLLVHFETEAVSEVNFELLRPELVGKSLGEVNEILKSRPEIERIDVELAPFWQKNFPWFSSKIKLILESV